MSGIVSRQVARAMASQLDRVNADPVERLKEKLMKGDHNGQELAKLLNGYQREVTDLQNILQQRDREVEALRGEIERLRQRLAASEDAGALSRAALTFHGQPVITVRDASARSGLSGATVTRYCQSGWWKAHQDPTSSRWFIDAEQPLTPKPKR